MSFSRYEGLQEAMPDIIWLCTKHRLILWSADDLDRQATGQGATAPCGDF